MTYTLQAATLELARMITNVEEGTATGGSTTTLIDTLLRTEPDDHFNLGTIFFLKGNNIGKSAVVTDYVSATDTFTFPTQSGACAASDLYAALDADYPQSILVQSINRAILDIGEIPKRDSTTLTTVADDEEQALPSGVYNVCRVEIAMYSSEPYGWQTHRNWSESDGNLVFNPNHVPNTTGYKIRLTYMDPQDAVADDADTISDYIHKDLLARMAAVHAFHWRVMLTDGEEDRLVKDYDDSQIQAEFAKNKHPIPKVYPDMNLGAW